MAAFPGSIAFDEYGRPFIIIRDQEKQNRLTGIDAIKVRIIIMFNTKIIANISLFIIIFPFSLIYLLQDKLQTQFEPP